MLLLAGTGRSAALDQGGKPSRAKLQIWLSIASTAASVAAAMPHPSPVAAHSGCMFSFRARQTRRLNQTGQPKAKLQLAEGLEDVTWEQDRRCLLTHQASEGGGCLGRGATSSSASDPAIIRVLQPLAVCSSQHQKMSSFRFVRACGLVLQAGFFLGLEYKGIGYKAVSKLRAIFGGGVVENGRIILGVDI